MIVHNKQQQKLQNRERTLVHDCPKFINKALESLLRATLTDGRPVPTTPGNEKTCARCGRRLYALPVGRSRRLQCAHCRLPVCRHCCSRTSNARWLCVSCRKLRDVRLQSGEWFYQQLRHRFRATVAALGNSDKNDGEIQEFIEKLVETIIGGGLDDVSLYPLSDRPEYTNFCALYKEPLVYVLQRLYANLKMALLDSDSVSQDGETTSDLHSELKDLMKQIIREAMALPQLKKANGPTSWRSPGEGSPESLGQRSYEDILATAILNKVFAKYQQSRPRRKRRMSNNKTIDKNSNLLSDKLAAQIQGEAQRSESEDSDSVANSVDEYSWSESSHHEPLSVTIEECIEEVTTRYSSDDDEEPKTDLERFLSSLKYIKRQRAPFPELGKDIVDGSVSSSEDGGEEEAEKEQLSAGVEQVNPVDSWEENWLFQRRRLKTNVGTCQPVPVPMLVPNPSEDYRAMIGGVDADEMSDLSDCSDSILEDLVDGPDDKKYFETQQAEELEVEKPIEVVDQQREVFLQYISDGLSQLLEPQLGNRGVSPNTDTGQEEPVAEAHQVQVTASVAELSQQQSAVSPDETDSSHSYSVAEARNLIVPLVQVDSGEGSLDMQQDSEYTVAYATVAQVRSGSIEPSPSHSPIPSPVPKPRTVLSVTTSEVSAGDKSDEERNSLTELSLPPKPGTIAEREHMKWEKAPPLANNPYSKENIARRQRQRMYLSRHSSSENSIEFPELTGTKEPSLLEIDSKHRRDDYNKYVRDYYVNVAEDKEGPKQPPARPASVEPRPPPQLANSCSQHQQVSVRVEVEVAVSKASARPWVPTPSQTTAHHHQVTTVVAPDDDDSYISLPSVKELAKQFSNPDDKVPTPTSPTPTRKVTEVKLNSPVRQVHSLTARNISREFRENLRGSKSPVPPVVKVAADKELDSSGHVSEDSGTVSPTPCAPPRRLKLQNDIQFWEQLKQQR